MNKNSEVYFGKLKGHLPLVKDPTVVILRGHLLVEELLDELIAVNLRDTSVIKEARLSFYQKLCIVQGFIGKRGNSDILKPIYALNRLRNEVGHRLPDATLTNKLDSLLKQFFADDFDQISDDIYSKSRALRIGIISLCSQLFGFIEGFTLARAATDRVPHP